MKLKEFCKETGGSTRDYAQIDPRLLRVRPDFNIRDLTTPAARAKLDILKAQIKAEGVLEPLEIEFDGETPWINEGHRRHLMVMELIEEGEAFKTVPCIQERSNIKPEKRTLHMLMRRKEEYEPLEYAAGLQRMVDVYGWDRAALAISLGEPKETIDRHLAMLGMRDDVQEEVRLRTVSATAALGVSRDAEIPDALKAQILRDAADEQARLGKKRKATPKAIQRVIERAKPKPAAETKAEPAAAPPETQGSPVSGVKTYAQLQEEIGKVTAPADEQKRRDREFEAAAPKPAPVHPDDLGAWMAAAPRTSNKIDALIYGFVPATMADLALQFATLKREHDEARADGNETEEQILLIEVADCVGRLHFKTDWENAKASTELQQVA